MLGAALPTTPKFVRSRVLFPRCGPSHSSCPSADGDISGQSRDKDIWEAPASGGVALYLGAKGDRFCEYDRSCGAPSRSALVLAYDLAGKNVRTMHRNECHSAASQIRARPDGRGPASELPHVYDAEIRRVK